MTRTTSRIRDLSPPGEILAEVLEERGITNSELARRTLLSEKHVSQLINARVPLSMDVALQLERVLGIPARFWNSLEFNYRAEQKREEQRADMANFADWMRAFPLPAMRKARYFGDRCVGQGVQERVEALLEFFGVASPEAWEKEWAFATGRFRKSPKFNPNYHALTAWLRRGELESQGIRCARFDETRFRSVLQEARALTMQAPDEFLPALVSLCASAGVALTLIPSLPGLAISGVTRWKGADKALVSLSLRFKSDDQLWFTFIHEGCHVLEHKTGTIYIDSPADPDGDADERRANEFARDTLIPPPDFARLVAGGRPSLSRGRGLRAVHWHLARYRRRAAPAREDPRLQVREQTQAALSLGLRGVVRQEDMNPTLSKRTITAVQKVVTGDEVQSLGARIAPYRSGPQLVAFFNEFGSNDSYSSGGGFPTRSVFAEERLDRMNGQTRIVDAIEAAMNPAEFLDTDFQPEAAAEYLNKYLAFDGLDVVLSNGCYRLRRLGESLVSVEAKFAPERHAIHEFIAEQIGKCDRKLRDDDYDGAITNARTAVEAVLTDIEARLDPSPPSCDGELARLYKRVQKLLNLDPERQDIADSLRQLLRGLVSIIAGLAPLRNKMGDAHVRTYKPARHHAKLAVNAAKTLLDFVYDTFEYQKANGWIREHEGSDGLT